MHCMYVIYLLNNITILFYVFVDYDHDFNFIKFMQLVN